MGSWSNIRRRNRERSNVIQNKMEPSYITYDEAQRFSPDILQKFMAKKRPKLNILIYKNFN